MNGLINNDDEDQMLCCVRAARTYPSGRTSENQKKQ